MSRLRPLALRVWLPVIIVIISVGAAWLHYVYEARFSTVGMLAEQRGDTSRMLTAAAAYIEGALRIGDRASVDRVTAALADDASVVVADLVHPSGVVLASTRRRDIGQMAASEVLAMRARLPDVPLGTDITVQGHLLHALHPLWVSSGGLRERRMGVLHIQRDLSSALATVRADALEESLHFAGYLALMSLTVWLALSRFITRPMNELTAVARRLGAGDLTVRARERGALESTALARAFNQMAGEIERKNEALEGINADLRALQAAVDEHAVVSRTDSRGCIIEVNDRFCEVTGHDRAALVGNDHSLLQSGAHDAAFYRELWDTINSGRTWHGTIENRRADGEPLWCATTIVPVMDSLGRPREFISVRTDITHQVRLRDAAALLARPDSATGRTVFETIARAVQVALGNRWTLVGEIAPDGETVHVRGYRDGDGFGAPFSYPLAGSPCQEVRSARAPLCITDDAAVQYPQDAALAAKGVRSYRGEPILDTEGHELGILVALDDAPCREDAQERALLRMAAVRAGRELERERTSAERDRLQRQLLQAQKMEAIGQLTGGIAHDFNNILASMLGYTELAMMRCVTDEESNLARYLHEILASGERARDMVAQLLAFSRQGASAPVEIDVRAVTAEVVSMLRGVIPASVRLSLDAGAGAAPVFADATHLYQALTNLCINARDAIAGTGRITVGVHQRVVADAVCQSCHQAVDGEFVVISVEDDGCGIAAEHLDSLFQPFFSTKAVGKGTGLGLSMVHGIAHQAGGHVLVHTAPGAGTRFELLLPASHRAPAAGGVTPDERLAANG
ncbi:MAG: PAS domain-containing protein [Ectothiorhodospiraceae bacterium]|nr:PAS domain-containing protein [Ectothiorhodospiraceae bacterium]